MPPGVESMVNRYEDMIDKNSAKDDLSQRTIDVLDEGPRFNWAYANLYRGYLP